MATRLSATARPFATTSDWQCYSLPGHWLPARPAGRERTNWPAACFGQRRRRQFPFDFALQRLYADSQPLQFSISPSQLRTAFAVRP